MIDFNAGASTTGSRLFGAQNSGSNNRQDRQDRPEAQVWANLGFVVERSEEDGGNRFVALPVGLPLDTMETRRPRGTGELGQLDAAGNDLLKQLQDYASALKPGEESIVTMQVQIRRIKDKGDEVKADESNPFSIKLDINKPAE
jgi:hypothetical protein